MIKFRALVTFVAIIVTFGASAQTDRLSFDDFYDLVVFWLETDGDDSGMDYEELENRLHIAYENPIDWNKADKKDFDELMFVPADVVEELLYYIYKNEGAHSVNELILVPKVDYKLRELLPYVLTVKDEDENCKWGDAFKYASHYVVARTDFEAELRRGYETGKYQGLPFKQIVKYRAEAGDNFKAGVTMETDAGEPWNKKGFDLYRAFVQFDNLNVVERVVVGAMKVSFGNGLIFGDRQYGNAFDRMQSRLNKNDLRCYGGTQEYEIMNGVGVNINPVEGLTVSLLYGFEIPDADTSKGYWKTIVTDGYHRTETEQRKNNTLMFHTIGGRAMYDGKWYKFGVTAYGGFFSMPSVPSYDNGFRGKRQWAVSADYAIRRSWFGFSGETAMSQDLGVATTNTMTASINDDYSIVLNHRYFSPKYHSYWASSYSVSSDVTGENGAALGLKLPIYFNMCIDITGGGYVDIRGKSKLGDTPFRHDLSVRYEAVFNEVHNLNVYFKFRQYQCDKDDGKEIIKKAIDEQTCLLSAAYKNRLSNGLGSAVGVQANVSRNKLKVWSNASWGWMVYGDLEYSLKKFGLSMKGRLEYFDASEWDNRFYLYEQNISESSYSPALYGKAFRWYFIIKYAAKCGVALQMKVAQTLYTDRQQVGSGNDLTQGNHRTSFNVLVSYRFKQ